MRVLTGFGKWPKTFSNVTQLDENRGPWTKHGPLVHRLPDGLPMKNRVIKGSIDHTPSCETQHPATELYK